MQRSRPRLCKDSVWIHAPLHPHPVPMPALVRASCEFRASHSCRLLGVGLLILPSFTSQFSLPLHRSSVTPPAYWQFLFYKVGFSLPALTADWHMDHQCRLSLPIGPLEGLAWGRESRDQCEWKGHSCYQGTRSLTVFQFLTAWGVEGSRPSSTLDSAVHTVLCKLCAESWASPGGASIGKRSFLIIFLHRPLLGWVRASCPPFWLCYWFCMVNVVPKVRGLTYSIIFPTGPTLSHPLPSFGCILWRKSSSALSS